MNLPLFIARRYLFARKSHNVINIISAISAIGMAVGTAALIIILSVYNGFDSLIRESLGEVDPDILVTPSTGKYFTPGDAFDSLKSIGSVAEVRPVLEESVFATYDARQSVARARGTGNPSLYRGETPLCNVSSGLAGQMGINPNFVSMLELYYPARDREVSLSNPLASLNSVRVRPASVFNAGSETAATLVEVPLGLMRELLGCTDEVSAVQIWLQDGCSEKRTAAIVEEVQDIVGPGFTVRDRVRQNESLFKMMKYEKISIFLILIFIIIIITFNILGSLTMLIIEKKEDIGTFRSMGATTKTLKRIFTLEGWLITLLGLAAGLLVGLLFAFLQQRLGLIKMPGGFLMNAYPVIIKSSDVILTAVSVAAVGYLIALIPANKRISSR